MTDNFNGLTNQPTLLTVLKMFEHQIFAKLNCMRIGIIDEILDNNEVRCSITNKKLMSTNADGTSVWRDYPPIFAKVYYMGSGNNNITYPLTIQTPCLLLFNDREFDSYFQTKQVSALNDLRMHSLSDCICIPLFIPTAAETLTIKGDTINLSATTINIEATTINIDGELIINGEKYLEHVHSNGNEGANTGGVVV